MKSYLTTLLSIGSVFLVACQTQQQLVPTLTSSPDTIPVISGEETGYPSAYPEPNSAQSAYLNPQLSPVATTTEWYVEVLPPKANNTTVTGIVLSEKNNSPIVNVPIFLAEVYYEGGQGAFVLDGASSPYTTSDSTGRFAFVDIPAGDYVVVIGNPEVTDYEIVLDETGKAQVWTANPGEILDLKEIRVDLNFLP